MSERSTTTSPRWTTGSLVPVYTGNQPVTLSWLWEQYNEHRMPLPKLLLVVGGAATGHDYRTGMFLNALALSGLAALMIVDRGAAARRPAVLRRLSRWPFCTGASTKRDYQLRVEPGPVHRHRGPGMLIVVNLRGPPTLRQGLLFGLCLLALPLCGSSGAALVPAIGIWLAVAGFARWRWAEPGGRRDGLAMMAPALAALVLLAVYLHSLQQLPVQPIRPSFLEAVRTGIQFLAEGFGPVSTTRGPIPGPWSWP